MSPAGAARRLRPPPVLLVLLAIASVQAGSALAKDLYDQVIPLTVVWLRLTAGALVLLGIARPRLRGRPARAWWPVVAYGLAMAGMNLAFYLAIERIPIGMAVTIEFLGPMGVAVATSRRAREVAWIALAALGVGLLGLQPGDLDPLGVGLALLAGAFWAAYIPLAGLTGRYWDGVTGVTVACWVGALAITPPLLVLGAFPGGDARVWMHGLLIGVLSSVIPYAFEMVALRRIHPAVFGVLMSLEPAAGALAALLVLGEQLRPVEVAAMVCVIVASIGMVKAQRPDAERGVRARG